jgi:predicted MPP superfamily phosphohydrolase
MNTRFLIFISVIVVFLTATSWYLGLHVIATSSWAEAHRPIVWFSLALFIAVQVLGPFLYRTYPTSRFFILHWMAYTALGIFACLLFYTAAMDLLLLFLRLLLSTNRLVDLERSFFVGVFVVTLLSAIIGGFQAVRGPKLYKVEVPIRDLPSAFAGYRIVQISDLHVGPTIGKRYAQRIVRMVNALQPDLVALTGDFVDGSVQQLQNGLLPFREISAKDGMYFITGNHEYYWGVQQWMDHFEKLGATVLINDHRTIRRNGGQIVIAGVPDHSGRSIFPSHVADCQKSIEGAPENAVKILLAHQPSAYLEAARAGFQLQLSGHTHGGQFFPWSIFVRLAHRYAKDLHQYNGMWIYVNRGAGYWGPPLRFGVPSEITLLTLRTSS